MSSADGVSREVAWRVFADEYDDATLSFKEGDDDRAPNYVVTPTGAKINRMFVVGVLTETENVGSDGDMYRARISDPTGAFVSYAGQYQQEAMSFFAEADPPMFVALVGKARTYEPEDGDRILTSVRPEEVNGVDGATRDRWNVQTARQTLARIDAVASYFRGTAETDGENALLARLHDLDATADHYDLDAAYLTDLRRRCLEVLADLAGDDVSDDEATVDLDVAPAEPSTGAEAPPPGGEQDEPAAAGAEGAGDRDDGDDGGFDPDDFSDVDQETVDGTGAEARSGGTTAADDAEGDADAASEDGDDRERDDATGGADAAADADEEWEWDEGERERLEEEFGAEFESAADIDEPGDGGAAEPDAPAAPEGDGDDGAAPSPGDDVEDGTGDVAGETGDLEDTTDDVEGENGDVEEETGADGTDAVGDETGAADDGPGESATDEAGTTATGSVDPSEDAEQDAAGVSGEADEGDAGTGGEDAAAGEDPNDVVMAVLEDADSEGLPREDVVSAAADRGLDEEAAEEALDDLLMQGLCYTTDDVIKPL